MVFVTKWRNLHLPEYKNKEVIKPVN
jgi:hypothetical protein